MTKFNVGDEVKVNSNCPAEGFRFCTGRVVDADKKWAKVTLDSSPVGKTDCLFYHHELDSVTLENDYSREDWILISEGLLEVIKNGPADSANRAVELMRQIVKEKL